jgi:hypothetical protein
VVPIAATRAQVCRFRRVEWLYASFRRSRGGRTDRRRSGQRQDSRNDRSSDQCLHGTFLMIPQRADNARQARGVSCDITARKKQARTAGLFR